MFEHAGIDAELLLWIGALQKNPAAISLLEQVRRDRHHALETAHLRGRPHVDVKIGGFTDWVLADDQAKARHYPIFSGFFGPFEGHKDHRVILIIFADSFHFMDSWNAMLLQLVGLTDAGEH